jgi:hypothetical protein
LLNTWLRFWKKKVLKIILSELSLPQLVRSLSFMNIFFLNLFEIVGKKLIERIWIWIGFSRRTVLSFFLKKKLLSQSCEFLCFTGSVLTVRCLHGFVHWSIVKLVVMINKKFSRKCVTVCSSTSQHSKPSKYFISSMLDKQTTTRFSFPFFEWTLSLVLVFMFHNIVLSKLIHY